jgi:hypothetical protein
MNEMSIDVGSSIQTSAKGTGGIRQDFSSGFSFSRLCLQKIGKWAVTFDEN